MTSRMTAVIAALLLLTFIACKSETTDGLPASDTTGTSQSPSTATSDPTTTGSTGGTSSPVTPADKEWVTTAGMAGLAEVQMGNLALQNAESADVKSFAQRMVTDHSRSNEELQQLVSAKGLALPAQLDGEHKSAVDHLTGLSGREFDKAYMQHMVADHDKAVAHFTTGSTSAQDADIKGFATKSLPVLQEHAALAKTVSGKLK